MYMYMHIHMHVYMYLTSLQCSFSHGGHLFAAANTNLIQLFSTFSFENTGNLKGHNGKVSYTCTSNYIVCTHTVALGWKNTVEYPVWEMEREGEAGKEGRGCTYTCTFLNCDCADRPITQEPVNVVCNAMCTRKTVCVLIIHVHVQYND